MIWLIWTLVINDHDFNWYCLAWHVGHLDDDHNAHHYNFNEKDMISYKGHNAWWMMTLKNMLIVGQWLASKSQRKKTQYMPKPFFSRPIGHNSMMKTTMMMMMMKLVTFAFSTSVLVSSTSVILCKFPQTKLGCFNYKLTGNNSLYH